jgi:hypothetical protein
MNFRTWINESVTFRVQDYRPKNPVSSIFDLSQKINALLMNIMGKGYETGHYRYWDKLTIDGYDVDAKKGILNFYSGGMDDDLVKRCLKAIKYYLGDFGVRLSGEIRKDKSNLYKMEVYRIPVEITDTDEDRAPEMNVTNKAANVIIQDIFQLPHSWSGSIPVESLLMKLSRFTSSDAKQLQTEPTLNYQGKSKPIVFTGGFDAGRIERYLSTLEQMAKWADKNKYYAIEWV